MWVRTFCARSLYTAAIAALLLGMAEAAQGQPDPPGTLLQIGMSRELVRHVPDGLMMVALRPMQSLMATQTGCRSQCTIVPPGQLKQDLAQGKLDLGVFHGYEFAWARQTTKLKPVVIAVGESRRLTAHLIVRKDSRLTDWHAVQGKKLVLPARLQSYCRFYLERQFMSQGKSCDAYFGRIASVANAEVALDDVVDGVAEVTVVGSSALACYQRRKPGRANRLKSIVISPQFPSPVIACKPGAFDDNLVRRFREGMVRAKDRPAGRRLLTLWKLTGFEPVPSDYEEILDQFSKAYPPRREQIARGK